MLFYSAGPYTTNQYGTNYAVSNSITGPYTKAFRFLMTTDSLDGAVGGPGGADVLHVGYANGSAETASHTVTVNGSPAGSISYPVTGWDNWRQATTDVTLQAGWNTIRLGKGTAFAELDYIEVA